MKLVPDIAVSGNGSVSGLAEVLIARMLQGGMRGPDAKAGS